MDRQSKIDKYFVKGEDGLYHKLKDPYDKNVAAFLNSETFEIIKLFFESLEDEYLNKIRIASRQTTKLDSEQLVNTVILYNSKADNIREIINYLEGWKMANNKQKEAEDKKKEDKANG